MICDRWDVVVCPFPFADTAGNRRRPALGVSQRTFNESGHTVLAMITSRVHAAAPGDCEISDGAAAGLRVPCIVRLRLFTLDNRLIVRRIGRLREEDITTVSRALERAFGFQPRG